MLCISLSSTDYIGHRLGPQSAEVEDTYLRLDKELADFFTMLDKNIGNNQYLIFLSADHGAPQSPDYLKNMKVPAGVPSVFHNSVPSYFVKAVKKSVFLKIIKPDGLLP